MTSRIPTSDATRQSRSLRGVHQSAALVAMLAYAVSLSDWPWMVREAGTDDWQFAARLAGLAGAAFLLLTAIALWRRQTRERLAAKGSPAIAGVLLVGDLLVATLALWVLLRGPESRTLLAGLGATIPALLTVAALSSLVTLLGGWLLKTADATETTRTSRSSLVLDVLRAVAAAIAIAAIVSLEMRALPRPAPLQNDVPEPHLSGQARLSPAHPRPFRAASPEC